MPVFMCTRLSALLWPKKAARITSSNNPLRQMCDSLYVCVCVRVYLCVCVCECCTQAGFCRQCPYLPACLPSPLSPSGSVVYGVNLFNIMNSAALWQPCRQWLWQQAARESACLKENHPRVGCSVEKQPPPATKTEGNRPEQTTVYRPKKKRTVKNCIRLSICQTYNQYLKISERAREAEAERQKRERGREREVPQLIIQAIAKLID